GGQIPFAQAAADGEFGLSQPVSHIRGDTVQRTATCQDHPKGPLCQPFELWLAQVGKGLCQFLRPNVQWIVPRHGASPIHSADSLPSEWRMCRFLTTPFRSMPYADSCEKTPYLKEGVGGRGCLLAQGSGTSLNSNGMSCCRVTQFWKTNLAGVGALPLPKKPKVSVICTVLLPPPPQPPPQFWNLLPLSSSN